MIFLQLHVTNHVNLCKDLNIHGPDSVISCPLFVPQPPLYPQFRHTKLSTRIFAGPYIALFIVLYEKESESGLGYLSGQLITCCVVGGVITGITVFGYFGQTLIYMNVQISVSQLAFSGSKQKHFAIFCLQNVTFLNNIFLFIEMLYKTSINSVGPSMSARPFLLV